MSLDEATALGGNVDVGLGVHQGKVVLHWQEPTRAITFDSQNAFVFAEALGRAAHEARFGAKPRDADGQYLANQIRSRLTEDMRDRLTVRLANVITSMEAEGRSAGQIALQCVEIVFREVA